MRRDIAEAYTGPEWRHAHVGIKRSPHVANVLEFAFREAALDRSCNVLQVEVLSATFEPPSPGEIRARASTVAQGGRVVSLQDVYERSLPCRQCGILVLAFLSGRSTEHRCGVATPQGQSDMLVSGSCWRHNAVLEWSNLCRWSLQTVRSSSPSLPSGANSHAYCFHFSDDARRRASVLVDRRGTGAYLPCDRDPRPGRVVGT